MSIERKSVAIITERIYPFYVGGSEKVMYDYARILSITNDVTVFTSFDQGKAKQELTNVKFVYPSKKIRKSNKMGNHNLIGILSFSIETFWNRQKIRNYDIVILDSIHYFYPVSLLKFIKRKNAKVVTIIYEAWYEYRMSNDVSSFLSYCMGIFIIRLIAYSDILISISDPTTTSLINNYKVHRDKVFTIPLGIDYDKIANYNHFPDIVNRRYDLLFVGRFASIKRVGDIIDAVSILYKEGRKLEVALIGDGPQKTLLDQKIKKLGINDSIHIFGFINEREKYSIMANSKIFILPSEREGFSLSTLEAMALGCIPIVSRPKYEEVFGVSHFVKNGENGIYYSVGNFHELAKLVSICLDNPETSNLMSRRAIQTANLYTYREMERKINDVLR